MTLNVPSLPIALHASPLGAGFCARGARDLRAACAFVHALPYGRNRDRADYRLVLEELRGTCSTKHALLAALGREQGFAIELRVGLYLMNESNTKGVGAALAAHGLDEVPEAHCYLLHDGNRLDLTHPGTPGTLDVTIFEEHPIVPEEIGQRKGALHQDFVKRWARARGLSFEETWRAREACIAALAAPPPTRRT